MIELLSSLLNTLSKQRMKLHMKILEQLKPNKMGQLPHCLSTFPLCPVKVGPNQIAPSGHSLHQPAAFHRQPHCAPPRKHHLLLVPQGRDRRHKPAGIDFSLTQIGVVITFQKCHHRLILQTSLSEWQCGVALDLASLASHSVANWRRVSNCIKRWSYRHVEQQSPANQQVCSQVAGHRQCCSVHLCPWPHRASTRIVQWK